MVDYSDLWSDPARLVLQSALLMSVKRTRGALRGQLCSMFLPYASQISSRHPKVLRYVSPTNIFIYLHDSPLSNNEKRTIKFVVQICSPNAISIYNLIWWPQVTHCLGLSVNYMNFIGPIKAGITVLYLITFHQISSSPSLPWHLKEPFPRQLCCQTTFLLS